VVGVLLFVLTLLLSLSGYLPPWDRQSVWAFTVGMTLGGAGPLLRKHVNLLLLGHFETGQNTLIRWYTLHVTALPFLTWRRSF
jgi:quinol-cytochrome oxidoreductase complex cytochrome b subunit